MDEDLITLNRAYSDLVAHSIVSIHIYEEYLMGKATSKELAVSMKALLKTLPTDLNNTKTRKPRKPPRKPSKATARSKRSVGPPKGKDDEKGGKDDI